MVTANGTIVGRDRAAFLREVEDEHGAQVADEVRFASLPVDERRRIIRHRLRAIDERMAELVTKWPQLKAIKRGR